VMKRVKPGAPLWILARVMQRSGVTGTGGLSPGRSGSPGMMPARSPPRDQGKKLGEELDRLRWSAPELVDSFGAHSRSEAKILVSYLIKRDELRLARVDPGLAAPDTGSRDSALTGSGPPEIKRIADRLRDGSSLRKAKHACLRLLETQGEWIPGSQLKLLGIPLTSARYHFKTARPGDGLVGGGSTPLQFRRTTLIEYVADHWTPRCAPKRRFKDLRSGGVTDLA